MDGLTPAPEQLGVSLAFHFFFCAAGIGVPVLLALAQWIGLQTGRREYERLAHFFAKVAAGTVAATAVSATVISLELWTLWPQFMRRADPIIGMPFSWEGYALIAEGFFLGLYLLGWGKLPPRHYWLYGISIALAAVAANSVAVGADAWLNTPAGFQVLRGKIVHIDATAALFNPSMPFEVMHTTLAACVFGGFAAAAFFAFRLLRARGSAYLAAGVRTAMLLGAVAIPGQMVCGHLYTGRIAEAEPVKFAALEGLFRTESGAPLLVGGIPDERTQTTSGGLEIPRLLSVLAASDPNARVRGLDSVPPEDRPHPLPVHLAFWLMITGGVLLLGLAAWWFFATRGVAEQLNCWLLGAICAGGPVAFVAMQSGWVLTVEGRKPWMIHGIVRMSQLGAAPAVDVTLYVLTAVEPVAALALAWFISEVDRPADAGRRHVLASAQKQYRTIAVHGGLVQRVLRETEAALDAAIATKTGHLTVGRAPAEGRNARSKE
jgi:cytochrome d ubiquinol oxidase subunit I